MSRANKQLSKKQLTPTEFSCYSFCEELLIKYAFLSKEEKLFVYFVNASYFFKEYDGVVFTRLVVKELFDEFACLVDVEKIKNYLLDDDFCVEDIYQFGVFYQMILTEGEKNKKGSYYTPKISHLLSDITPNKILDPACGSGFLLIMAKEKYKLDNSKIFGLDNDYLSTLICRYTLLFFDLTDRSAPNIKCVDSLDYLHNTKLSPSEMDNEIDYIISNPPWGGKSNKNYYTTLNTKETFSLFIERCLLLYKNSRFFFLLPISITNVDAHKNVRRFIINNSTLVSIKKLGRIFSNVFTEVISLELEKTKTTNDYNVNVDGVCVPLKKFYKDEKFLFNSYDEIIDKIERCGGYKISSIGKFHMGIVTGDNKKLGDFGTPIIVGGDIARYKLSPPSKFLNCSLAECQQSAPQEIYNSKKIVYKFISNKLMFAIDEIGYFTLNSANNIIVIDGLEAYYVAFFNSKIINYYYRRTFDTLKVLKGNIDKILIPKLLNIDKFTNLLERCKKDKNFNAIDDYFFDIYGLTEEEIGKVRSEKDL